MTFKLKSPNVIGGATFSHCRTWRYQLWREWDEGGEMVAFIGLNPSVADETEDDNTVRRCIQFARDWGYAGMLMLNLFGLRSTDPSKLYTAEDPAGPDNDEWIWDTVRQDRVIEVVLCWGNHGAHLARWKEVWNLVNECEPNKLRWFGLTKAGQPKHPLYLKRTSRLSVGRSVINDEGLCFIHENE